MSITLNLNSPQTIGSQNLQAIASEALALESMGSSFSLTSSSFALLNSVSKSIATPKLFDGGVSVVLILFLLGLAGCDSASPEIALTDAGVVPDQDEDGKPDAEDECPEVYANTFNGCPPARVLDRDGDGILDDKDECPNDPHPSLDPEANGCAPFIIDMEVDGGLPAPMPDPSAPKPWALLFREQINFSREQTPFCPHLSSSSDQTMLAWQEGSSLMVQDLFLSSFEENNLNPQNVGLVEEDVLNMCNLTRALAINGRGQTAMLLPRVENNNEIHFYFRLRETSGHLNDELFLFSLPLSALNSRDGNTLASIKSLPNNNFALVWTDRDRVNLSIVSSEGDVVLERVLVNKRSEITDALQVKNPDLSLLDDDTLEIVWQEGNGAFGDIVSARFTTEGEAIKEAEALSIEGEPVVGRFPFLGADSGKQITVFSREEGSGGAQVLSERLMQETFLFGEVGTPLFSPHLTFDRAERLALSWIETDQHTEAKAYLASVGSVKAGVLESEYRGALLSSLPVGAGIAMSQQGDDVVFAYPSEQAGGSLVLRRFQWNQIVERESDGGE